ncbi:acetyl-CoA hydrolase/transferase C-terminal domain-containing protein [Maricaulaceae bacterium MS644]
MVHSPAMKETSSSNCEARADRIVQETIARVGRTLVLGLPLALGKANHLANAFYRAAKADPALDLTIYTALSLDPPRAPNALAARLLDPIAQRLYAGYPRLDYVVDRAKDALPANVQVKEFFLSPGGLISNAHAQANYVSANYTHAGQAIFDSGLNVVAQMVAPDPGGAHQYSLSCNPDLSLDLFERLKQRGEAGTPTAILAEVNPQLPWFGHDAVVPAETFDAVLETGGYTLFPVPSEKVGLAEHAIALHAAGLVRDGGTLQIGIGALGDGLAHAVSLRHEQAGRFASALDALAGPDVDPAIGGRGAFEEGLYGCSEMVTEGLINLLEHGVLTRAVYDDLGVQTAANEGRPPQDADTPAIQLHGGFYLGSTRLYRALRNLPDNLRDAISMTRIGRINQLYGSEALDRAQRKHARFFNTAMMVNGRGAAISDTLHDGRVVSGIGGQYNFVAMAHELEGGRSVILVRATRTSGGETKSNIVWEGGEVSVPRHLRDIVVTEYGVADLKGATDREVAVRLARICDSRFQGGFLDAAKAAGKVEAEFQLEAGYTANTPERLAKALKPLRDAGVLPDYPLGSDLTPVERDLKDALGLLKGATATVLGRVFTVIKAILTGEPDDDVTDGLIRMGLDTPQSIGERIEARLVAYALRSARESR